jgi:hypothetical protein
MMAREIGIIPGITRAGAGSLECKLWTQESSEVMFACSEVRELSDVFVDGELFAGVQARFLRHIQSCADCAAFLEEKIGLKRLVRAGVRSVTTPSTLRNSIRMGIGA